MCSSCIYVFYGMREVGTIELVMSFLQLELVSLISLGRSRVKPCTIIMFVTICLLIAERDLGSRAGVASVYTFSNRKQDCRRCSCERL